MNYYYRSYNAKKSRVIDLGYDVTHVKVNNLNWSSKTTMAKVATVNENVFSPTPTTKHKKSFIKPSITYAKPLYYVSLLTGLSCQINLSKYRANSGLDHKIYSVFMISLVTIFSGLAFYGREVTCYDLLIQTIVITDIIQQAVLLVWCIYAIAKILLCGKNSIEKYFEMMKLIDTKLTTTMKLKNKTILFYTEFFLVHIMLFLLYIYDYWAWTTAMGINIWKHYAFRLYTFYMNVVIVLQICTFSSALKIRFKILNERLFDVSTAVTANLDSQETVTIRDLYFSYKKSSIPIETSGLTLRCIIRMHDMLCDVIGLLNEAFGFNMVFLVCTIIINSVMALNITLTFSTGLQPSDGISTDHVVALNIFWALIFLGMGWSVASCCDSASKEAWKTATIAYKLLNCVPTESSSPKERETRVELTQLAQQIEHRRPVFDAAGFFPVNHTMLYAIVGAISSYIVIIIQFNNSPIKPNYLDMSFRNVTT